MRSRCSTAAHPELRSAAGKPALGSRTAQAVVLPLLLAAGCVGEGQEPAKRPPASVEGRGMRAFALQKRTPGLPEAIPGDLVLQRKQFSVQIGGPNRPELRGAVFALQDGARTHDWEALYPLLAWDGRLHEIRVERVVLGRSGDRPTVIVHGVAETPELRVRVRRALRLADVEGALRITTQLDVVLGTVPRGLEVVERVGWGGGAPLAPLAGTVMAEQQLVAEWIGQGMNGRAVVVSGLAGPVRIVGRQSDHGRADALRYTDVFLPATPTGRTRFRAESAIVTSLEGLGDAARRLGWVRGQPFREIAVTLTVSPPGAEVRLLDAATGSYVSSARPDAKLRARLPLPGGELPPDLVLVAVARGREASERVPLAGPPYGEVTLTIPEGSKLEVRAEHGATGDPIPVRIRVLPRRNTRAPDLGPDWSANGAIDTVIASAGYASIPLPTGYYRVIVTHGPEWSVHDQAVELGVRETTRVRARLEHVVDPGAWVACEFHVHAAPSPDSQVAIEDRVASLVAEGVVFAVPTDHNHVTDYGPVASAQPLQGLLTVPGVEVTTEQPRFGHFNAFPYPFDPDQPAGGAPEYTAQDPLSLFAALHAADPDLVVQVNHPRLEGGIGYFDVVEYDPIAGHGGPSYSDDYDALEVWNGYDLARREQVDRVFAEWLAMIARGRRVVATGSSDSHTIRSEMAGYPRTYVRAPAGRFTDARALVRSLRSGHAFVTSGPFLGVKVEGRGPGEEVQLEGDIVEVDVRVQVPSWMQVDSLRVYLGDELVHRSALSPTGQLRFGTLGRRYERTLKLPVSRPGPLVVAVEGQEELAPVVPRKGVRPFAFTNPIWLVEANPNPNSSPSPNPSPKAGSGGHGHDHGHEH